MARKQLLPIRADKEGMIITHTYLCDTGGCGYYRTIFPALAVNSFQIRNGQFCFFHNNKFISNAPFYNGMPLVKFQRSATNEQMQMIKYMKEEVKPRTSIKLVYELDDDFLNIPATNYAMEYYQVNRPYVEQILRMVDGITVSTKPLKDLLSPYCENIQIIPNYLLKSMWDRQQPIAEIENRKPRIGYYGSFNHFAQPGGMSKATTGGDFGQELIDYVARTTDKYDWVFLGGYPHELIDLIKSNKIEYHEWVNILKLPEKLLSLKLDIGLAPLEDNLFNKSKSDLKLLEYTALGIPSICSDLYPYSKAACKVKNDGELIAKIEELVYNTAEKVRIVEENNKVLVGRWMEDNVRYWLDKNFEAIGRKLV